MNEEFDAMGEHEDIAALEEENEQLREKLKRLKRGNTALIEALMDMCSQHCFNHNYGQVDEFTNPLLSHDFVSSNEGALALLVEAGFAETDNNVDYRLLYDKLKARIDEENEE